MIQADNQALKQELAKSRRMDRQQIEELKKLLYIASHDIRSPLLTVEGFADELELITEDIQNILKAGSDLEEVKAEIQDLIKKDVVESVEFVRESISQLDSMIGSLLVLSRAAHQEVRVSSVNMDHLINRIRLEYSARLATKQTRMNFTPLPPTLADETILVRVFEILIDNAISHQGETDKREIEVYGQIENEQSVYHIKDCNTTLPSGREEEVFQVFRSLTPKADKSKGIGLAEARILVMKMDGELTIEPIKGEGVHVLLKLPAPEVQ